jgi:hypothetical protein
MIRRALGLTGLLLFLIASVERFTWADNEKYSITAIHAHLYHESTGEINRTDLLDGKVHMLRNSVIGEGEGGKPSNAVWILVELVGPTFANIKGKLSLKAIEGDKILLDQTLQLHKWFNEGGRLVLPFLVYGTGGSMLEITATLQGLPAEKILRTTLKKSIPFEIGE